MLRKRRQGKRSKIAAVHLRHAGRICGVLQIPLRVIAEELMVLKLSLHISHIELGAR